MYLMAKMLCPACGELIFSEDVDKATERFYADIMGIVQYHREKQSGNYVPPTDYVCPKCGCIFEGSEVQLMDRLDDIIDIPW